MSAMHSQPASSARTQPLPKANSRAHFSTRHLPANQKADFWVDCVNSQMINLDCPDEPECGLDADLTVRGLGGLTLNRIQASRHSIQRSLDNIRKDDRESAFMCLMLEGDGFAYQGTECSRHGPGDVVIYNTVRPYAQGFQQSMDMVVVDIPHRLLQDRFGRWNQKDLIRLDRNHNHGGYSCRELFRLLQLANSVEADSEQLARLMLDEVYGLLHQQQRPGHNRSLNDLLLRSQQWIRNNLQLEDLSLERLSHELHTSRRQLARAFELDDTTVNRFIWHERLQRCREALLDPSNQQLTISEIAFRWGFNHSAHFSRSYRSAYGESPTETRQRSGS